MGQFNLGEDQLKSVVVRELTGLGMKDEIGDHVVRVQEVDHSGKSALIVYFHTCSKNRLNADHMKVTRELQKKIGKQIFICHNRSIMSPSFRRGNKSIKIRPRSRTLTAVQTAMLGDLVAYSGSSIIGQRTKHKTDGSVLAVIQLHPKSQSEIEPKLQMLAAIWKKFARKDAVFVV